MSIECTLATLSRREMRVGRSCAPEVNRRPLCANIGRTKMRKGPETHLFRELAGARNASHEEEHL